jgi:hypothetical protein
VWILYILMVVGTTPTYEWDMTGGRYYSELQCDIASARVSFEAPVNVFAWCEEDKSS